jgi:hypothetical protein
MKLPNRFRRASDKYGTTKDGKFATVLPAHATQQIIAYKQARDAAS